MHGGLKPWPRHTVSFDRGWIIVRLLKMNQKRILRVNLWLGSWLSRDAVRGANGWSGFMSREVRPHRFFVVTCLALLVCSLAYAQEESERINSNVGASLSLPLSPTSNFVKTSWGLVGGAGYNFSSHHSVIGEFMWSALHPSEAGLEPIRAASKDNNITGHSNLYSVTGNYRFEWQWRKLGAYFIGGGGWYYRTLGFTGPVSSGTGTECVPAWIWWGFTCTNGTVTPNQSRGSYTSSVLGGNVGAGLTIKVGEPSYRIYIEPRYHYAPTKNVSTHLLEVTFGIRY